MKKKKQKVQIFKLEERVLFDGAAAAEIVAAVNNAGEADNADQADNNNEPDQDQQQEKFVQNTVQNAGPVEMPVPDANVQNDGEGIPQADAAQNDPADVLINGNADFSQPVDVNADAADAADADADTLQVSAEAGIDAVDQADLIVLDQDAADRLDIDVLDGKNVLVLDGDSDAADQIDEWMSDHDDQDVDHVLFVSDSDTQDIQLDHAELDTLSVEDFQSSLDQDASDDLVIMPDNDSVFTVDADTDDLPAELSQDADADRHELVILNSNTAELDSVLDQLGDSREVLVIDNAGDAFDQISDYLDNSDTEYDAVHILTHGNDEGFYLGHQKVIAADQMSMFDGHMADHGDFMLYGCDLASTDRGQALIDDIAAVTGCDVAASADITGSVEAGGNWTLEYSTGAIETTSISLDSSWDHRLAAVNITVDSTITTETATNVKTFKKALQYANNAGDDDIVVIEIKKAGATDSGPQESFSLSTHAPVTVQLAPASETEETTTAFTWNVVDQFTVQNGASLSVTGNIMLTNGGGGNVVVMTGGYLSLTNTSNNVDISLSGSLSLGSTTVSNVTAENGGSIQMGSSSTISHLELEAGSTPWSFSNGTVESLTNYHSNVTGNGTTWNHIANEGGFTLQSGKVTELQNDGTSLAINGGQVATLTSYQDVTIHGGTVTTANLVSGNHTISGGTIAALNIESSTANVSAGTISNMTSESSNITVSGGNIADFTHQSGDLTVTGGSITTLNNDSSDSNVINGAGATVYGLVNGGNITLTNGTISNVDNVNGGTVIFNGATVTNAVTNEESSTLDFNADSQTGLIYNAGIMNLNNGITLSIETGSGETAVTNSTTGVITFDNATLANTAATPIGTGLSNTAGGTVNATAATATISGFNFASEQLYGVEPFTFTSTGNTFDVLNSLTVRGSNSAIGGVESMNDALDQISQAGASDNYSVNINLLVSEYSSWSDYLTVTNSYAEPFQNLYNIASNTIYQGTLYTQQVLLQGDLTLAPSLGEKTVALSNVSLTVDDGASLTIASDSTLALVGTSPKIVQVIGETEFQPTVVSMNSATQLINNGSLTVTGNVFGSYYNLSSSLQSIVNNGTMTMTGNYTLNSLTVATAALDFHPQVDLIFNAGTLTMTGSTLLADAPDGVPIPASITISSMLRNTGTADLQGVQVYFAANSNSNSKAYAIYNDGDLTLTDSFVEASGTAQTYGLFVGVNGDATFAVTQLPDIDLDEFSGVTNGMPTVREYADQIYHIKGGNYSVYNEGAFQTVNNVSSGDDYTMANGLLTGTVNNVKFRDAPIYALIGKFQTFAVSDNTVSSKLSGITLVGSAASQGTARNDFTNLIINGNVDNTISEIYVAGFFKSSDFAVGNDTVSHKGYYGSGSTINSISITNHESTTEGMRKGGAIYFGFKAANMVRFNPSSDYEFYNLSGEMIFNYFGGLSSEAHPAQFYNRGVLTIDGTNAEGKIDGLYPLYVKEAARTASYMEALDFYFSTAEGISDKGIVNQYNNQHLYHPYKPRYESIIPNQLTLTNLNVRNMQDASAAVTNYAGNLTVNGGKLSGTYSGLDNMEEIYRIDVSEDSIIHYQFHVVTPHAELNGVESIAGAAYSIRNSGDLSVAGTEDLYTLLTNKLDFSTNHTGDYTALLNSSIQVYAVIRDYSDSKIPTAMSFSWKTLFSSGSDSDTGTTGHDLVSIYQISSDSLTNCRVVITDPDRVAPSSTVTTYYYGDPNPAIAKNAVSELDYVSFLAQSTPAVNTAMTNWGTLTVTHVDVENQFNGFKYMLDISQSESAALTTVSDIEVGFVVAASTIKSGGFKWKLTMRGVQNPDSEYLYTGGFDVNGSALGVSSKGDMTLVNFSVAARNSENAIQVDAGGLLKIYNGTYDSQTRQWIGGSSAVISSDGNANGIMLYGRMEMINGAITACVDGIKVSDVAGLMIVANSTIAGNSGWGITSDLKAPGGASNWNLGVFNSTIAYNGNGGIQLNNGGRLTLVNSILLNKNPAGSTESKPSVDLVLNGGSTLDSVSAGNVYGSNAHESVTLMDSVFGSQTLNWTGDGMYTISLVENSEAWNASVKWTYSAGSSTVIGDVTVGGGSGYQITFDKMGNAREESGFRIGSYVLSGSVGPTAILVTTLQDSDEIIIDHGTKFYSLRYVLNYLLSDENTGANTQVQFNWDALYEEAGTTAMTISLDAAYGSLVLAYTPDVTLIDNITIDLATDIPADYALTIDGSGLAASTFVVSGIGLTMNGGNALTVTGSADTTDNGAVFNLANVEGTQLALSDSVITGGNTTGNGGAVYVGGANAGLTATDTTFSNNQASAGGAIYLTDGSATVTGNFVNNIASTSGGAIFLADGALTVTGDISGTAGTAAAAEGGAAYVAAGELTVTGNLTDNEASASGGAIYLADGTATVTGNITGSTAGNDGGAIYLTDGTVTVTGNITGSTAGNMGGAIYLTDGTVTVTGDISGSNAGNMGGAAYVAAGELTVTGNLTDNEASASGGAIYQADGTVTVTGNITGSTAGNMGGAAYVAGGELTVTGDISDSTAGNDGGAVYNTGSFTLTGNISDSYAGNHGGAIYNTGTVTMTGDISDSEAGMGGAIYNTGTVMVTGNIFNNLANNRGGAIYADGGSVTVLGDITGNTAYAEGSVAYVNSGTVQIGDLDHYISLTGNHDNIVTIQSGELFLVNALVKDNGAPTYDLFTVNGGTLTILNSTVTGNDGNILTNNGTVQIGDSTIAFNDDSAEITNNGTLNVANSIINAANDFTVTNEVKSLINVNPENIFALKNGAPVEGLNGTLLIRLAGEAATGGVMVGYKTEEGATTLYYTTDGETWNTLDGEATTVTGITEVAMSQNESERLYSGYDLLSIGAYSLNATALSLVVTISGDESVEGETTLRDAVEYANYLYATTGEVQQVTFNVNEVTLDSKLTISTPVNINGPGVTISTSGTFTDDTVLTVAGDTALVGLTIAATDGVRGITLNSGNLSLNTVTVRGANVTGDGGAIYAVDGSISGVNVHLVNNTAADGAAIYSENASVNLYGFLLQGNTATDGSVIHSNLTTVGSGMAVSLRDGTISGNISTGDMISVTNGAAALISVTALGNGLGQSLLSAKSADIVNATLTGDPQDFGPLVRVWQDLNVANSVITTSYSGLTSAFAPSLKSAYSVYSGSPYFTENVENSTGYSTGRVFTGQVQNGQMVIADNSPAAMGVWTQYDPITRAISYSVRPNDIWTESYSPEYMTWRYLGGGAASYNPALLVGSTGYPSIGAYNLTSWVNRPDAGPGVNTGLIDPSFNGGFGTDWGYNSVVNGYLQDSQFLTLDSGMSWYATMLADLFGFRFFQRGSIAVRGEIPSEDMDLSVDGVQGDFDEFREAPYHADDGSPLSPEEQADLLKSITLNRRQPEDSLNLSEAVHQQVASSLRSAELFKDSFDKALESMLGQDA